MAQHPQLARLHVLQHRGGTRGDRVDLPAEQGDDCGPGAGERHVRHLDAGVLRQDFHGHVHGAVVAGRAVVDGARALPRVLDELLHRLPGRFGAHGQHCRVGGEACDGAQRIEREHLLAAQHHVGLRQHGERRQRQQHGVAVRGRLGGQAHADAAAGAGLVLDHHRLAQVARHRFGDGACHDVCEPARRERHDHGDGLGGVGGLGGGHARCG